MDGCRAPVVATFSVLPTLNRSPSIAVLVISYYDFDRWLKWTGRTKVMADFNTYKGSFPHTKLIGDEALLRQRVERGA
jgi:hypothetical protein